MELDGVVGDVLTRQADGMIPEGPQPCPGEGEWVVWVYKSADVLILGGVMLHTPQARAFGSTEESHGVIKLLLQGKARLVKVLGV